MGSVACALTTSAIAGANDVQHELPYPESEGIRSIPVEIILTLVTCGLYGLYWYYKQMETMNAWLDRDEYNFLVWLILTVVTCGIFGVYYAYKMAQGINEVQEEEGLRVNRDLTVISLLLTLIGLGIVTMAIQQSEINKFYDATANV